MTGVSNERILEVVREIKDLGFVLEVLSLYIPGWVETDQISKIADLVVSTDPHIPFTILAYFPAYKMTVRSPTFEEMSDACEAAKRAGLQNVRLGNLGVVARK